MSTRKRGPNDQQRIDLKVDFPGLITIFGDALYQDFGSVVRELTQNCHDSIVERATSTFDPTASLVEARIHIQYDEIAGSLVVADDGTGMTRNELADNLNNFARRQKDVIQSKVNRLSHQGESLLQVIGEYHVGFLSAMAVSSELQVWSMRDGNPCVHWLYHKGSASAMLTMKDPRDFALVLKQHGLPVRTSGTLVVCKLSDSIQEDYDLSEEVVRQGLTRYAALLPIPVFFNDEQISGNYAAWNNPQSATEQDWQQAITQIREEEPLLIIPVFSPPNELDVQGVLWIPERAFWFTEEPVDVYVKRMFVFSDDQIVVPPWARFVSGMINSNKLRRIVSGNTVKNDKNARLLRDFIKDLIIAEFARLRRRPEIEYSRIVSPHEDRIKGSAGDDPEFLECVWDKLRFPSRRKKMTIPDYLSAVKRKINQDDSIFYYDKPAQEHSASLVEDATGIPVLGLFQSADDHVVRKICGLQGLNLRSFKELADEHFREPPDADALSTLISACAENNIAAEIRSYTPAYLPAVLIEDNLLQERRDRLLAGLKQFGEEHFARDLEKWFVRAHAANFGVAFYLNSENELIRKLATAPYELQAAVCLALYNTSFMAAIPDLRQNELRAVYGSISAVMLDLVARVALPDTGALIDEHESIPAEPAQDIVTLFMITPFSDEYRNVEQAIRIVFEKSPYFFRVVLARDYTYKRRLVENVKAHIRRANAFIVEISDLNPNVMLELGAVLFPDDGRPVFSLRSRNAKKEVPTDLKAELYLPYGAYEDSAEVICRDIRSSLEKNGRVIHDGIVALLAQRKARALTRTLLDGLAYRLDESQTEMILRRFETVEDFMGTAATEASKETGLKKYVLEALRGELDDLSK